MRRWALRSFGAGEGGREGTARRPVVRKFYLFYRKTGAFDEPLVDRMVQEVRLHPQGGKDAEYGTSDYLQRRVAEKFLERLSFLEGVTDHLITNYIRGLEGKIRKKQTSVRRRTQL